MKDLFPIGLCMVLPVMIVWLVNRTRQNETNRRTGIMLKAIVFCSLCHVVPLL